MLYFLPAFILGPLAGLLYLLNVVLWCSPLFIVSLAKLLLPWQPWRTACTHLLDNIASAWIGCNGLIQRLTIPTEIHSQGVEQLCLQQWYLVLANHQSWVDILILQRVLNGKIPLLKFFLKKELIWVPILGLAWWALEFPFMQRYSKAFLAKHPHLKGKDIETTRKACERFRHKPTSIMNFVEGTRFTEAKYQRQDSPYRHLLKPRAGGIAFVLNSMGTQLQTLVDVTIYYPQGAPSFWDFLCGRVKQVRVEIETQRIDPSLIGDYVNDPGFQLDFQLWLNQLWQSKDAKLDAMARRGTDRVD